MNEVQFLGQGGDSGGQEQGLEEYQEAEVDLPFQVACLGRWMEDEGQRRLVGGSSAANSSSGTGLKVVDNY